MAKDFGVDRQRTQVIPYLPGFMPITTTVVIVSVAPASAYSESASLAPDASFAI